MIKVNRKTSERERTSATSPGGNIEARSLAEGESGICLELDIVSPAQPTAPSMTSTTIEEPDVMESATGNSEETAELIHQDKSIDTSDLPLPELNMESVNDDVMQCSPSNYLFMSTGYGGRCKYFLILEVYRL